MVHVHEAVGTLVVLAFLALTIVTVLQATGRTITWSRELSFGAAGLLLVQYVLGFGLLSDHHITPFHYIIAILGIIPVGLEHGYAQAQPDQATRNRLSAAFAAATTVLVIIAYAIGQSNK